MKPGSIEQRLFLNTTSVAKPTHAISTLVGIPLASTIAACTSTPSTPASSAKAQSVELRADGVGAIAIGMTTRRSLIDPFGKGSHCQ